MTGDPVGQDDYAALVRDLLQDLGGTSITHLDLRHGDLHIALHRQPGTAPAPPGRDMEEPAAEASRPEHWHAIAAPLTGLFYARPSPNDESYVHVGSSVQPDSVIGLIESMKMFNEVTADIDGIVREIAVENGALIESGQPILYVEPGDDVLGPPSAAL